MAALGVDARVEVAEADDEVVATVTGGDLGVLIGRHGQMIDALQYLANAIAHRAVGDERRRIVVDAAGYRARRSATLETLARRSAEQASATARRVELEPMSAVERRIVHEALKDDPEVETASEGAEPNRYVVVLRDARQTSARGLADVANPCMPRRERPTAARTVRLGDRSCVAIPCGRPRRRRPTRRRTPHAGLARRRRGA